MARIDPLRNFRYRLEIDSITQAGFSEVAIAETTIEAIDYREGTDPPTSGSSRASPSTAASRLKAASQWAPTRSISTSGMPRSPRAR